MKKKYNVHLKSGRIVEVESEFVKVKEKVIIFGNYRQSLSDQYINGSQIVATFNLDDYSYFIELRH